jgi:hypothetical protein
VETKKLKPPQGSLLGKSGILDPDVGENWASDFARHDKVAEATWLGTKRAARAT